MFYIPIEVYILGGRILFVANILDIRLNLPREGVHAPAVQRMLYSPLVCFMDTKKTSHTYYIPVKLRVRGQYSVHAYRDRAPISGHMTIQEQSKQHNMCSGLQFENINLFQYTCTRVSVNAGKMHAALI